MKKSISVLVVFSILLTLFPLGVFATSPEDTVRSDLIATSCELFPEFADAIRSETPSINSRLATYSANEIVYSETRSVDDNTEITLMQYSDDAVLLAQSDYNETVDTLDYVSSGVSKTGTLKLTLVHTYSSDVFIASGVKYTNISQAYDQLNSTGDLSASSTYSHQIIATKFREDADGYAYVHYWIHFTNPGGTPFEVSYYFYVGSDKRWTECYG